MKSIIKPVIDFINDSAAARLTAWGDNLEETQQRMSDSMGIPADRLGSPQPLSYYNPLSDIQTKQYTNQLLKSVAQYGNMILKASILAEEERLRSLKNPVFIKKMRKLYNNPTILFRDKKKRNPWYWHEGGLNEVDLLVVGGRRR